MSTGGRFPGGKARPGRDADRSPYLVSRLRLSTPPWRLQGDIGTAFLFTAGSWVTYVRIVARWMELVHYRVRWQTVIISVAAFWFC
jgi:hypothetical protein